MYETLIVAVAISASSACCVLVCAFFSIETDRGVRPCCVLGTDPERDTDADAVAGERGGTEGREGTARAAEGTRECVFG